MTVESTPTRKKEPYDAILNSTRPVLRAVAPRRCSCWPARSRRAPRAKRSARSVRRTQCCRGQCRVEYPAKTRFGYARSRTAGVFPDSDAPALTASTASAANTAARCRRVWTARAGRRMQVCRATTAASDATIPTAPGRALHRRTCQTHSNPINCTAATKPLTVSQSRD